MKKIISIIMLFIFIFVGMNGNSKAMAITDEEINQELDKIYSLFKSTDTNYPDRNMVYNYFTGSRRETHKYVAIRWYNDVSGKWYDRIYMIPKERTIEVKKGLRLTDSLHLRVYNNGIPDFTNIIYLQSASGYNYNVINSDYEIEVDVYCKEFQFVTNFIPDGPVVEPVISILSPSDGFKDNVNIFRLYINYKAKLNEGETPQDNISLEIIGGKTSGYRSIDSHSVQRYSDGTVEGYLVASVEMNPGENQIQAKIKYVSGLNEYYATDTKTYYYYTGIVDENGDGIDDRTNQPVYTPPSDDSYPKGPPEITEGSGILGYISWLFESIFWVVDLLFSSIRRMFQQVGSFTEIIGQYFTFLPHEILTMIFIGIMISIVLRVVGR